MSKGRDNFGLYASYYDLLYKGKDYRGEVDYLDRHIKALDGQAKDLLNLGSGTGRHDRLLAQLGYTVTGVDLSQQMVDVANSHPEAEGLPVSFVQGDAREVRLEKSFDVVTSLFHVFSYQTSNQDLEDIFRTAYHHLNPGGHLLFDCWYGPGVLSDPPTVRVKRLQDDSIKVTRLAEPVHHPNDNIIDVNYEVQILDRSSGQTTVLNEVHRMRYLFTPEVRLMARLTGFEFVDFEVWLDGGAPKLDTWNVLYTLRKD